MREFLAEIADHYIAFWTEVLPFAIAVILVVLTLIALFAFVFIILKHLL